jgi:UDP-galactopyranose mutase
MYKCDFLIVGAGFSGSTIANLIVNNSDKKVVVVEKKSYVGGHSSDYINKYGILVHRHGPHYFRTNSSRVINFLSEFAGWVRTKYVVRAYVDGKYYPFPINRDTLSAFFNVRISNDKEASLLINNIRRKIDSPKNFKEEIESRMGHQIYEKFFKNYTKKQWGIDPAEIRPSVAKRIPIRTNTDDSYVNHKYQQIPKLGYSKLVSNMLNNKNIRLMLNTDYKKISMKINYDYLVYTGPVDEFYNYRYGRLPYRSLAFRHETYREKFHQNWVQVNYPNDYKFTRIVEVKHITKQKSPFTTIVKEYPRSEGPPYYPLVTDNGVGKYKKYLNLVNKEKNVIFIGRLAEYRYINMDQAIENAMIMFDKKISKLL